MRSFLMERLDPQGLLITLLLATFITRSECDALAQAISISASLQIRSSEPEDILLGASSEAADVLADIRHNQLINQILDSHEGSDVVKGERASQENACCMIWQLVGHAEHTL
jgi:hypothetical protein